MLIAFFFMRFFPLIGLISTPALIHSMWMVANMSPVDPTLLALYSFTSVVGFAGFAGGWVASLPVDRREMN